VLNSEGFEMKKLLLGLALISGMANGASGEFEVPVVAASDTAVAADIQTTVNQALTDRIAQVEAQLKSLEASSVGAAAGCVMVSGLAGLLTGFLAHIVYEPTWEFQDISLGEDAALVIGLVEVLESMSLALAAKVGSLPKSQRHLGVAAAIAAGCRLCIRFGGWLFSDGLLVQRQISVATAKNLRVVCEVIALALTTWQVIGIVSERKASVEVREQLAVLRVKLQEAQLAMAQIGVEVASAAVAPAEAAVEEAVVLAA
jgi:hypothetical protein